jgi:predicted nucleotidyltransferase
MLDLRGKISVSKAYSTRIRDTAVQKRRLQQEQHSQEVLSRLKSALAELSQHFSFKRAVIFGSITRPYGFTEASDIDVAVEGLDDHEFFRAMGFLSRCLGREVDLLQIEAHRLAGKIESEGLVWNPQRE